MTWNCRLRGREAGDVFGVVVATALREDGARVAAAALPGSRRARDTQIGIIAELIIGQGRAGGGQEMDGIELRTRIVDHRREIGRRGAVIAEAVKSSGVVIGQGGGIALPGGHGAGAGRL